MKWIKKVNQADKKIRTVLFLLSSIPSLVLLKKLAYDDLGINPFATLSHTTGEMAIIYLLITLSVTPVRKWLCSTSKIMKLAEGKRLSDWNFLIRTRRQLGLFSFFYASLHLATYLILDVAGQC